MGSEPKVIIIMGSGSDLAHAEKIEAALTNLGLSSEKRVASAHKSARHLLDLLDQYEAQGGPRVYIAIAGRSNALAGLVDASVVAPVIACPPYSEAFGGADIFSSLRMPGGVGPTLVLEPANAALAAAKILGLGSQSIQDAVRDLQRHQEEKILEDDADIR